MHFSITEGMEEPLLARAIVRLNHSDMLKGNKEDFVRTYWEKESTILVVQLL